MATQYASGKYSIAECDRCGQRYKLKELKKEIIKTKLFQIKVCPECWDPDQPQLSLGLYPVYDHLGRILNGHRRKGDDDTDTLRSQNLSKGKIPTKQ